MKKWIARNAAQFERNGFGADSVDEDNDTCMQAGALFDTFIEYVSASRSR